MGKGAYSQVRVVINKRTGVKEAVKIFKKDLKTKKNLRDILREAEILMELDHENVVKFRDFYVQEDYLLLVTEKLDMDLYSYINKYYDKICENDLRKIF